MPPVVLNNVLLPILSSAKNLGAVFDSQFTWKNQIKSVCGKIYASLRTLWNTAFFTPLHLRKFLAKSLVMPHINYCASVYGRLQSGVFGLLRKAYNATLRYVFNLNRFTRNLTSYSIALIGCDLRSYLNYRILTQIFKIIHTQTPKYLFDKLSFGRSRRALNINVPNNITAARNSSFFVYGVSLYNSLPIEVRRSLSITTFKRKCFEYLTELRDV